MYITENHGNFFEMSNFTGAYSLHLGVFSSIEAFLNKKVFKINSQQRKSLTKSVLPSCSPHEDCHDHAFTPEAHC